MGLRCQLSTRSLREGSVRVKPFLHLLWLKGLACNHGQIQATTTRDRTARELASRVPPLRCPAIQLYHAL